MIADHHGWVSVCADGSVHLIGNVLIIQFSIVFGVVCDVAGVKRLASWEEVPTYTLFYFFTNLYTTSVAMTHEP